MSDLFHEDLPDEAIDRVFAVMALCPQHTFQVLTKRPQRMLNYFESFKQAGAQMRGMECGVWLVNRGFSMEQVFRVGDSKFWRGLLPNVWLGVSVENFATWDARAHLLKAAPAAKRFVSYEPALEDLGRVDLDGIDWVIVGGESGPGARPFNIEWARNTIAQCKVAGVACFVKQLGANPVGSGDSPNRGGVFAGARSIDPQYDLLLNDRKGGLMSEWPKDLRVREFPCAK